MHINKNYFKIIQITDTHLFKNNETKMFEVSCNHNFDFVIEKISDSELNDTDAIFLTGDLSQDESAESYYYLRKKIEKLGKPVYWIPGNHDSVETMENIFSQTTLFQRGMKLSTQFWDFIFINSKTDKRDDGFVSSLELKRLAHELKLEKKNNKAIIMHHHPMPVNTPLIDNYILENRDDFWKVINDFKVDLIICGHVHHDYTLNFNKTYIETSPATCLQWKKGTSELASEKKVGYKIYYFWKNMYEAKAKMFDI